MHSAQETVLEIDLDALEHNFRYLKSLLDEETKFLGVVKAFAYGSDSTVIAKKLEHLGVDYLAVAYVKEGVVLRDAGVETPILVLHPLPISFDEMIDRCLEPSLYSSKILDDFLQTAKRKGQKGYPVHLKFNTGLNRLGFTEADIESVSKKLNASAQVNARSVFSHLAASEDHYEKPFTLRQIETFERIWSKIGKRLEATPFRHLLNTSGVINYPQAQYEMVRSGIGLYGFGNEAYVDAQLKPVATLKTVISQIHTVAQGESVGYNRAFVSETVTKTATLPLGHADGIGRPYGNGNAFVSIRGKKAPIIGNVCMDMIMVDVTDIACQAGDEVIVFGQQTTADEFARGAGTISYELLTGISQRVTRQIIGGKGHTN